LALWKSGGRKVCPSSDTCRKVQTNGRLAASFFFSNTAVPARNDGNRLISTLVFQLVGALPGLKPFVENQICEDLGLFSKSREVLSELLLLKPLTSFYPTSAANLQFRPPLLVVIDGLDECQDANIQCDMTSPLEQQFAEIHRVHVVGDSESTLVSRHAIDTLEDRSSGHFIYASTAMRYIQSLQHRPDDRLQVILGFSPGAFEDRPYAQLDALYTLIFDAVPKTRMEAIHCVLGILHFFDKGQDWYGDTDDRNVEFLINDLLDLKPGDPDLLFDPLRSLVAHKSLFDHLFGVVASILKLI
jgi:hypothetical protein